VVERGLRPALRVAGAARQSGSPLSALASVLQPMHSSSRTDVHERMAEHESLIDRWPTLRRWLDEGPVPDIPRPTLYTGRREER
jgi:hypothetical protein